MRRSIVAAMALVALALPSWALAAATPVGTYSAKIAAPAPIKGTWVLHFTKAGTYTITDNGAVVVRGSYTSTSRIYLSKERGTDACPQFGVYRWKRTATSMSFTKVSDPCTGRASVLAHVFKVV
jgi:hypothetical protein